MKRKRDFNFSIKYMILLLTILCLGMMVVTYAKGETIAVYKNALVDVVSPVQTGFQSIGDWVKHQMDKRVEKEELLAELERLKEENALLNKQLADYQSDYIELNDLRKLFQLQEGYEQYSMIGARVIGKESGSWFHKFSINRGSADGIEVDMNVLAVGGLAGIVTDVGEHFAIVTSILDDQMNVSAISRATRDSCMVMGDLESMENGYIRLMYIAKDAQIQNYDEIITSATSSKYLPGLLIGYAININMDANNLSKSGYLIPAADFETIDTVLVITDKKQ